MFGHLPDTYAARSTGCRIHLQVPLTDTACMVAVVTPSEVTRTVTAFAGSDSSHIDGVVVCLEHLDGLEVPALVLLTGDEACSGDDGLVGGEELVPRASLTVRGRTEP